MTELPMLAMGKSLGEYVRNHIVSKVQYNQITHIVVLALDVLHQENPHCRNGVFDVEIGHGCRNLVVRVLRVSKLRRVHLNDIDIIAINDRV